MSDRRAAPPATLPDYVPMAGVGRTDAERWPLLSAAGLERVRAWRAHPHAPVWRHECGDLVTEADLATLRAYDEAAGAIPSGPDRPLWVDDLVARCCRVVPRYRGRSLSFADVEPVCRDDLAADVASFVPDDLALDRVIQTSSSGTTGAALVLPVHPATVAAEVVLLEHLVADSGIGWPCDTGRLAILSVTDQQQAYTYVSALTWRREQLMARVNLAAAEWRHLDDRRTFLEAADPQVVSGTPLSLVRLARLDVRGMRPLALFSGALTLTPAARAELTQQFGAPVLDLYGLKETGPFAVDPDDSGHVVVSPDVWVEALGADGRPVPDGTVGELTATSRANAFLPLLRYRTGDRGALSWRNGRRVVTGLTGRAPVAFDRPDGTQVPSVDLHQHLQHHGAIAWEVAQDASGDVVVRLFGGDVGGIRDALEAALGRAVTVEEVTDPGELGSGKPRAFRRL